MFVGATCVLQSASVSVHLCNPSLSCTRSMAPTLPPLPSTKHLPPSQIDCENREVRLVGKGLLPPPSRSGCKLMSNISSLSKCPQKIQNEFSETSSARTTVRGVEYLRRRGFKPDLEKWSRWDIWKEWNAYSKSKDELCQQFNEDSFK